MTFVLRYRNPDIRHPFSPWKGQGIAVRKKNVIYLQNPEDGMLPDNLLLTIKFNIMGKIASLTPEDIEAIRAFLEDGDTAVLKTEAIDRLYATASAMGRKLADLNEATQKKCFTLERRLDRYKAKEATQAQEGVFEETGLDSLDVATALLYCIQQHDGFIISKTKLIHILYEMYASWLASKRQRLFVEHPVAAEWGPQLWRVYKKIENVRTPVLYQTYASLAQQNPAVAAFCRNAAAKYYDWREKDLRDYLMKGAPYKNATPEKNNGKWGKEISDADIFAWKATKG